ncbi:ribosome maturation factor RimP [Algoriphagus sp. CAU 1675]|uniref:ribosome maturation factor RimP n=1 Tax=Algoriphagus sp. CAU 1675 TaxID=3032597 RepID=UPI0023DC58BF|nr:ribosome maturation factor RimP [Algoriphagus sp. CAU 1675]MDF2158926.1 ribosome maturation factor RimP [Algoriphagus sp. CAU 1675]
MSDLKYALEEIVEKYLPGEDHFVVAVDFSQKGGKGVLHILIDADQGVTIDTCAKVSRDVADEIEARDLIESAYTLEVSSPGVDYPLGSKRQYQKNVGRELKVLLQSGQDILGKLEEVTDTGITLRVKKKEKGKKAVEEAVSFPFEEIKKSIVQVSFK